MIEPTTLTRLTPEQREHWDTQGYLVLPGVLATDEIERLINAVDRLDEASQRDGRAPDEFLSTLNVVEEDDAFLNLIDHPRHLGILMDLMGACIQLITSQVMVRPPTPHPGSRWHFDGPKPYPFPRANGLTPLLHLKIGWFLTDLDAPDMGNFLLIPGSHRGKFPRSDADAVTLSSPSRFQEVDEIDAGVPGAEQVLCAPATRCCFTTRSGTPSRAIGPRCGARMSSLCTRRCGCGWATARPAHRSSSRAPTRCAGSCWARWPRSRAAYIRATSTRR